MFEQMQIFVSNRSFLSVIIDEKPVFFISSNNDDRSSSHQQHLEMVPAPQKMRIDIPTVVIDMEEGTCVCDDAQVLL
jgi:hypothetical protein